jgi:hypothetical protein
MGREKYANSLAFDLQVFKRQGTGSSVRFYYNDRLFPYRLIGPFSFRIGTFPKRLPHQNTPAK